MTVIEFERAALDGCGICRTAGCGRLCDHGATFCPHCAPQFIALGEWEADRRARQYREVASGGARRLENLAWISGGVAVFWYLIWCFRDFILACFYLWFGSGLR